jgi:hypothetical protein
VEYWECAKRREESCCTGSGLRVERGVNLEVGRETRESVRMADRGFESGGIMYPLEISRDERNFYVVEKREKYNLKLGIQMLTRRR